MKFQNSKLAKTAHNNPKIPFFARLADEYLNRGQLKKALELSIVGCDQFPTYATGFVVLSRCHQAQGNHEEARSALDRALRIDAQNPAGFASLATIYEQLGEFTLAVQCMQQASILEPYSAELKNQIKRLQLLVEEPKAVTKEANGTSSGVYEYTNELVEEDQGASELSQNVSKQTTEVDITSDSQQQTSVPCGSRTTDEKVISDLNLKETQEYVDFEQSHEEGLFDPEPKDCSEFGYSNRDINPREDDSGSNNKITSSTVEGEKKLEIKIDEAKTVDVEQSEIEVSVSVDSESALEKTTVDNWAEEEFLSDRKNQEEESNCLPHFDDERTEFHKTVSKFVDISDNRASKVSVTKFSTRDDRELVNLLSEIGTSDSTYKKEVLARNIEDHVAPIPTATLADLYKQRGIVDKAIAIYKEVLIMQPEDNKIQMKLEELEQRSRTFNIHSDSGENG